MLQLVCRVRRFEVNEAPHGMRAHLRRLLADVGAPAYTRVLYAWKAARSAG